MARRLEERLAELHAIATGDGGPTAVSSVRDALRSKTGILIGAAAAIVAEGELGQLVDELPPAFRRLLERPIERDPMCRGKVAIARALHRLDHWAEDVFPLGIRHVQREPVFDGSVDTAGELRGVCGVAYAHAGRPDALEVLAELLADPERAARAAAAQALGDAGRPDAAALLRFKALVGDEEPAVLAACFGSLLALTGEASLSFVGRFLAATEPEERAETAALAMAESRLPGAFPLLRAWCEDSLPDARGQVGYLALALLRHDPATDYLVDVIESGDERDAIAAARALATFRDNTTLAERALAAAARRSGAVVAAARAAFAAR